MEGHPTKAFKLTDVRLITILGQVMKYVEALEGKGFRMALTRGETKLGEQLRTLTRQVGFCWLSYYALNWVCGELFL